MYFKNKPLPQAASQPRINTYKTLDNFQPAGPNSKTAEFRVNKTGLSTADFAALSSRFTDNPCPLRQPGSVLLRQDLARHGHMLYSNEFDRLCLVWRVLVKHVILDYRIKQLSEERTDYAYF